MLPTSLPKIFSEDFCVNLCINLCPIRWNKKWSNCLLLISSMHFLYSPFQRCFVNNCHAPLKSEERVKLWKVFIKISIRKYQKATRVLSSIFLKFKLSVKIQVSYNQKVMSGNILQWEMIQKNNLVFSYMKTITISRLQNWRWCWSVIFSNKYHQRSLK